MKTTQRPTGPAVPGDLPRHFDSARAEERWSRQWEADEVYRYRGDAPRCETFVIDTPPPTVSGSLHVGHVFSYTQTDVIARYQRMRGMDVFYPMGWDDNGLPTERRVQNCYHVTCDPGLPYDPQLSLGEADARARTEEPRPVSRRNFIELCSRLTAEDEKAFMELWRRTGLSVDWSQEYSTVGSTARRTAQQSFLDLFEKGLVYGSESPTMWDVDFQTAVAQAEIEDREQEGAFYRVEFGLSGVDERFVVATTRPELLAACVGVAAHPDDRRYRHLFGRRAETPLFLLRVPIFAAAEVDPGKGTGIVMVCTFGDATDVQWWREHNLPLRQVIGPDGRMREPDFDGASRDPAKAREVYRELAGRTVRSARRVTEELLRRPGLSVTGERPALIGEPEPISHPVKFYEKGRSPIEFMSTRQWFVRLLDRKEQLIDAGQRIRWVPEHMGLRYRNWTENLQFDWCISRQRYFGVPFPVWYPLDNEGRALFAEPVVAADADLPVDPMLIPPPGYREEQRDRPGGFTGERDVFDTWFTSSLSPQIVSGWLDDPDRHRRLFPMDVRPQAHDIIRTWAFYTIAKSVLHEQTIPWRHALISGWILDPDRKKMSKSIGNVVTPLEYLERYTADGVRYWAASARLGVDTAFDESVLKVGRRLVTKLYNAGKFVLGLEGEPGPVDAELDRAFLHKLAPLALAAGRHLDDFDYSSALAEIETFFFSCFTDAYIELAKARARSDATDRASALGGLRLGLNWLLRLFAPFLPFITEELWSWSFASQTATPTVHRAPWPAAGELAAVVPPVHGESFDVAAAALSAIHKRKTLAGVSLGTPVSRVVLEAQPRYTVILEGVLADVSAAARAATVEVRESGQIGPGEIAVAEIEFAGEAGSPA